MTPLQNRLEHGQTGKETGYEASTEASTHLRGGSGRTRVDLGGRGRRHTRFSGKLKDGGKVEFRVKFRHGDPVKVLETSPSSPNPYSFSRVPVRCDGGKKSKIDFHLPELKVDARGRFRFSDSAPDGFSMKAKGRFVSNRRVNGTFRWEADVPYPGCDTGKARWTAER